MVGPGPGEGQLVFDWDRASVWEDEMLWGWMVVVAAQQCECT